LSNSATIPHAIFFDMDGTILDWTTGMEESWIASCEAHCTGGLFVAAEMHAAIRERRTWFWSDSNRAKQGRMDLDAAAREIVRHAFIDSGLDQAELAYRIADDYRARRLAVLFPYPGALETLAAVRGRGIRTALLTNGEARNQRRSVERHSLEQYFDCIIIEGEFGVGKPDERVFRYALEACGANPESTWMVGDSLEADIAPAVSLGLHAVWVDELGDGLPEGTAARPHRIIRAITELL
jgi:putative hydrolase of the HAD superfamily